MSLGKAIVPGGFLRSHATGGGDTLGTRRRNFRSSGQEWGQRTYKIQPALEWGLPLLSSVTVGDIQILCGSGKLLHMRT